MSTTPARAHPRPRMAAWGEGGCSTAQIDNGPNGPGLSTPDPGAGGAAEPHGVAIQVWRPLLGKWVTVAKVVRLGPDWVLAVPYRHRRRLDGRISLPLLVLRWAWEHGARWLVVRYDQERQTFLLPLEEALRQERQRLDGQDEVWLPLNAFKPIPWVGWPYVEETIRLGPGPDDRPKQGRLPGFEFTGGATS